ncbi:MAG: electron transport complex subunit RsxC, partial [Proteobacteria bacterium]|nr:electron transport complex subunit RsxC [Pseudomonadota bacterium]
WAREREKKAADTAKTRFEFRNFREEREKAEKAERLAKAAAAKAAEKKAEAKPAAEAAAGALADAPAAQAAAPTDAEAAKKAAIAAAMERARQQREAAQPKNTEALTPVQQRDIAEVDARRRQAGIETPGEPSGTADANAPAAPAAGSEEARP